MKKLALLTMILCNAAFAQSSKITWVGQFPPEQAAPVVEMFNKEMATEAGFTVEYTYDEKVITSLLAGIDEGRFDLVHMKDADTLNTLARLNLSTAIMAENMSVVPAHLRDSSSMWVGLLKRARIIYYNSDHVTPEEVQTYESLGNAKFKDRLCLRQKKAQYNTGLYSFFVGMWGADKTREVLNAWSVNSAALPLIEKDQDGVLVGLEKGDCWVGVANTYYYMRHLRATPNAKVKYVMPNQNDIGAHVNVDGVAILKSSKNASQVQMFVNWMLTEKPQLALSQVTDKHPTSTNVESTSLSQVFGTFKEATAFDLNKITDLKDTAAQIATESGLK